MPGAFISFALLSLMFSYFFCNLTWCGVEHTTSSWCLLTYSCASQLHHQVSPGLLYTSIFLFHFEVHELWTVVVAPHIVAACYQGVRMAMTKHTQISRLGNGRNICGLIGFVSPLEGSSLLMRILLQIKHRPPINSFQASWWLIHCWLNFTATFVYGMSSQSDTKPPVSLLAACMLGYWVTIMCFLYGFW